MHMIFYFLNDFRKYIVDNTHIYLHTSLALLAFRSMADLLSIIYSRHTSLKWPYGRILARGGATVLKQLPG